MSSKHQVLGDWEMSSKYQVLGDWETSSKYQVLGGWEMSSEVHEKDIQNGLQRVKERLQSILYQEICIDHLQMFCMMKCARKFQLCTFSAPKMI